MYVGNLETHMNRQESNIKKVPLSENWDIDLASYDLFKTKVPKHTGCDYGSTYT